MRRNIVGEYEDWEREQIAVLKDPSLAAQAPPGYRRKHAERLAAMSLVERQQMLQFSLDYQGRRGWVAAAKLLLAFTLAGVLLHLLFPAKAGWGMAIALANLCGVGFALGVASVWFNYRKIVRRKVRWFLSVIGGALVAVLANFFLRVTFGAASFAAELEQLPHDLALVLVAVSVLFAAPLIVVGLLRNRQYEALTEQLQRDAERERLARELSESQLRLLRAQIEPHFLFNTLGAVQQLAEQGAPRAAALTANLIAFLRASLSEMRSDQVALGAEFGLVEAYLKVMKARLGARLDFTLTLPDALAQLKVPSMILLTLAENAIKHGIEPSLHGGQVNLSAEAVGGQLRLRVQDSGVGMSVTPGAGLGLENVRHRLALAYPGAGATLALQEAEPGLIAEILIPNQSAQQ
ncbi:MAG TPA: histidine kinase [Telluria sp.]